MTRWLPTDQPSPLPAYAFTQVPTTAHPSRHQSVYCRLSPTPPPAPSPGRRRRRRRQLRGPCADGAGARLGNTSADFRPPRLPRPTSGHLGCTSAHLGAGARLSDGEDAGQLETAGRASRAHRRARLFGGPFSDASRSLQAGSPIRVRTLPTRSRARRARRPPWPPPPADASEALGSFPQGARGDGDRRLAVQRRRRRLAAPLARFPVRRGRLVRGLAWERC